MADQAERVILEAEGQVSPVVDKANAGLDSFEKKAESSHGKVIRISDQTRSSVQRLIASLEEQAETYAGSALAAVQPRAAGHRRDHTIVPTALGPFGVAVATGAAVLGTIAVSAFEAAKSLGEYGKRVKDGVDTTDMST